MVLHRCHQLEPTCIADYDDSFRRALCDKDPAVMGAALNLFIDLCEVRAPRDSQPRAWIALIRTPNSPPQSEPARFKDLVPSFVSVLKQITEHRLPRDFDYHRMPAPWIQIKLLKVWRGERWSGHGVVRHR